MTRGSANLLHTALALVDVQNHLAGEDAGPAMRRAMTKTRRARRPPRGPDAWLTVEDVADQLNISETTVYRALHDGALPASKVGRKPPPERSDRRPWRIRQADVTRYAEGQRHDPYADTWVAVRERGQHR